MNGKETYKAIAEALPWEIQSTMLAIRDDGLTKDRIPDVIYIALYELQMIEDAGDDIQLSRLGNHLVDFCTC